MNGKEEQNRDPWAEIDPSDEEVSINMSRTTRIPDMTKYPNCKVGEDSHIYGHTLLHTTYIWYQRPYSHIVPA